MNGPEQIEALRKAGFADHEIGTWAAGKRQTLSGAGFSEAEIDTYFGKPPFDPAPVIQAITAQKEQAGPKPVKDFAEAFEAGFGMSTASLLVKPPDKVLSTDAPRMSRIAAQVGTLLGDLPALTAGYIVGGANPITGTAGAMGLTEGIRKVMMDKYEKGEVDSFAEFWDRAAGASVDTLKGWVTGAATGAAGKAIGLLPIASPAVKTAATFTGEVGTMTTVGNALEGRMPEPDDFIDAAIVMGGIKGVSTLSGKLRGVYTKTGVRPDQVAQDVSRDATIHADALSANIDAPFAYTPRVSVADLHAQAKEKGMPSDNNPAYQAMTELFTGKAHLDDLTPRERQGLSRIVQSMQQPVPPTTTEHYLLTVRGKLALPAPAEQAIPPRSGQQEIHVPPPTVGEKPIIGREVSPEDDAPLFNQSQRTPAAEQVGLFAGTEERVPLFEAAQLPRHQLPIDQNAELLARAEKGLADVESAGQERGARVFRETQGKGSDQEVTGLKSATSEWYKEATTGEKKLSQQRVEVALRKIIAGKGADVGKDVQRVKELLFQDTEFNTSPFAPRTDEEWSRAKQYAMAEWEPDIAMGGGAPPSGISATPPPTPPLPSNQPINVQQRAVLSRIVQEDPKTASLTLSDLRTSLIDNLNPILKVMKEGGHAKLEVSENPYALERLTRGTMGKAMQWLKYGSFDFETYTIKTKGYEQILAPVKDDLDGFRAYIVSKRAIEKAGQGIETGIPLAEAKAVVSTGTKKYETIHQARIAYRNELLNYLEQGGILSKEAVASMREANKDYVPFYRFFEEDAQGRPTTGQPRNPIKQMKGSERQILDPIVSDIKDTALFIALAEKNAARQAFVALGPDYAVKQAQPIRATKLTEPEIRKLFDAFLTIKKQTQKTSTSTTTTTGAAGAAPTSKQTELVVAKVKEALIARGYHAGEADQYIRRVGEAEAGKVGATVETIVKEIESTTYIPEMAIRLPNAAAVVFRSIQAPVKKDEIAVFIKGKREVYKVDPKVAEAFQDADRVSSNMLTNALLHVPASLLRAGVVLTPDFIARNVMRDAVSAFIYAGSNPIKTAKGMASILKKDTAFQKWLMGGGANATMVAIDRDFIQSHIMEISRETGLARKAWNVVKTPLDLLRATSELVENATRLGAVRDELLAAKTKAKIQALSMIAREATVDFAVHGKDTQEFAKMTAFFNPAIQGIDRFAREMKKNPTGTTAKALMAITLPELLLWWANKDDKEIQDLPNWQKHLFMMTRIPLPHGDSFILRIPRAQEFGLLFGALPVALVDRFINDNPHALDGINDSLLNTFTPSLIPTTLVPIVGQFSNRNTFTGQPIIPAHLEKVLPAYQYTDFTTETSKALGQLLGAFPGMETSAVYSQNIGVGSVARALTTPVLIETYIRGWTGGMGTYLLQLADAGLRKSGVLPDPPSPPWKLSDMPVIKAFVARYPAASSQAIQDFFTNYDGGQRYVGTLNFLVKEGNPEAAQFLATHRDKLAQLTDMRTALTESSALIRMIAKNPEIPGDEQGQLIDTIYGHMIELSRAGNTMMDTIQQSVRTEVLDVPEPTDAVKAPASLPPPSLMLPRTRPGAQQIPQRGAAPPQIGP